MDEVEYCIVRKNGKMSADEIRKLPQGTIPKEVIWGWGGGNIRVGSTCRN